MYRIFTAIFFMLSGYTLSAQERGSISGVVKDNTGAPVPSATVNLLNASDSSWVRSELTGDKGDFTFNNVTGTNYLLDVAALGFEKLTYTVTKTSGIDIALVKKTTELQEVVVKSKVPAIRTDLGKTIVNFEQTAIPGGSNILDLLRRTPGVTVDGNGNVSMNGKGVLITINDKQSYLSGDDLVNYLKSIPAEQVAQLDLMSQPSAKYDAEGNTGIINIKTRKSKKAGLNGSATVSYGQGRYASTDDNATLNYRKNKLTLFVNASYGYGNGFLDRDLEIITRNKTTSDVIAHATQHSYYHEVINDYSLNVDGSYDINDKLKAGCTIESSYHPNNEIDNSRTMLTDYATNSTVYNDAVNAHGFLRKSVNSNVNLRYEPAKDQVITINGDYVVHSQKEHELLAGKITDAQGQELPGALTLRGIVPMTIDVYAAKADYAGKLQNGVSIEAGVKSSLVSNSDHNIIETVQNSAWQPDTTLSNNYLYNENVNAAYVSASKNLGEKWQAQLGLRVENTNIDGTQSVHDQHFSRSFTNAFPTAFVSYKPNDKHSFELNCGRRISRPSYHDLNPFVVYTSQYNYASGNPELLPELRYAFVLRHNYKNTLFTEMTYARVFDISNPVLLYDAVTKAVNTTMRNNANKYNLHFSMNCNKQLYPWWMLAASYDFYYNDYQDYNGNELVAASGQSFGIYNQFSFGDWTVDTFYNFNSGDQQSLIEHNGPSHWMNAGVAKKLWKDSATIKLSFDDPFNVYKYTPHKVWNGVETYDVSRYATQRATVSFTYNFGKNKGDNQRHSNKSEETQRM